MRLSTLILPICFLFFTPLQSFASENNDLGESISCNLSPNSPLCKSKQLTSDDAVVQQAMAQTGIIKAQKQVQEIKELGAIPMIVNDILNLLVIKKSVETYKLDNINNQIDNN
ncbi:hypothetical protein [Providencia alcalifaciens]|uniref:hypothetical protein n=1 Tax=Providencia alcalifaciens TaxID=126385 RepID=UPI003D2725CF